MSLDGLQLKATAHVTVTKLDEHGNIIGVEKRTIELTKEEAQALWHSQQPE